MKTQLFSLITFAMLAMVACQAPATEEESESPDYAAFDNATAAINALISAHSAEDLNACGRLLADTLQWSPPWYNGNQWLGKEDCLSALEAYHTDFDNIQFQEGIVTPDSTVTGMWSGSVYPKENATTEPDVIRVYGTWTGTHTESGKDVGVKWFALGAVNDAGQITSWSEYFDVHGLAAQVADEE